MRITRCRNARVPKEKQKQSATKEARTHVECALPIPVLSSSPSLPYSTQPYPVFIPPLEAKQLLGRIHQLSCMLVQVD
jgi:hypothetical protein